jgi:2-acylglycerol O-acyltransferase 2
MSQQPASATAGDRAQVHTFSDDELARKDGRSGSKTEKRGGPQGEGRPGWSDSFGVGGSEWLYFAPLSIPRARRLQTLAVILFPLLLPLSLVVFFIAL